MVPYTAVEYLRQFAYEKEEYNKYQATKNAVRNMIIDAVDDKYICHLRHKRTMYQAIEPITLLEHLWTTYGTVDDGNITANEARIKQPWNPPTSIETLYQQLEVERKYAKQGDEEISERQLYLWGYDNILATELFNTACEKWRNKVLSDKSWKTFKKHFSQAEKDRQKTTAKEGGFSANAATRAYIKLYIKEAVQKEIGNFLC